MTQNESESRIQAEVVSWFAEAVRNHGVAPGRLPTGLDGKPWYELKALQEWVEILTGSGAAAGSQSDKALAWLKELHAQEFSLDYEPRCLAVSPLGNVVAVGTKAGVARFWTWTANGWCERHPTPRNDERQPYEGTRSPGWTRRRAVRMLGFLDEDHVVISGGHDMRESQDSSSRSSQLRVVNVTGEDAAPRPIVEMPSEGQHAPPGHEVSLSEDGVEFGGRYPSNFFHRAHCFVPLLAPGRELEHVQLQGKGTPVGVVLTVSSRIHLLMKTGTADIVSRALDPNELLDVVGGEPPEQLVAGCWWQDLALWFLSSRGELYEVKRAKDGIAETTSDGRLRAYHRKTLKRPPRGATMHSMRACWDALGVRADRYFSLIAAVAPPDEKIPPEPLVDGMQWIELGETTDFTVFRPFLDENVKSPPDYEAPVWLLASSEERGLTWVPWKMHRSESGDGRGPLVDAGWRIHGSEAGTGASEALVLAHGARRNGRPEGTTPCFLAVGTRDHRLRISSLIHYSTTLKMLDVSLPTLVELEPQASPGVRLLRGVRAICHAFGLKPFVTVHWSRWSQLVLEHDWQDEEADILRALDPQVTGPGCIELVPDWMTRIRSEQDLLILIRSLGRCLRACSLGQDFVWSSAPLKDNDEPRGPARVIRAFRRWALRILLRSVEFDVEDPLAVRVRLSTALLDVIKAHARGPYARLQLFGELLNKWVRFGHTYKSKGQRLSELVLWNLEGRRDLDALAYITQILHRGVDRRVSVDLAEPPENSSVLAIAIECRKAAFSVHAHHDGRITAADDDGRILRWVSRVSNRDSDLALLGVADDRPCEHLADPERRSNAQEATRAEEGSDGGDAREREERGYMAEYRTGPYARALWLHNLSSEQHLLVFSLKGWRHYERKERKKRGPLLVALILQRTEDKTHGPILEIIDVATREDRTSEPYGPIEIYSFVSERDVAVEPASRTIRLLAGTRGPTLVVGAEQPRPHPFIRVDIQIEYDNYRRSWTFTHGREVVALEPATHPPEEARRQPIGEQAGRWTYNPVTALARVGESLLLTGRDDGRIEVFRKDEEQHRWRFVSEQVLPHARARITTIAVCEARPTDSTWLVAYGSSDGSAGALLLSEDATQRPSPLFQAAHRAAVTTLAFHRAEGNDLAGRSGAQRLLVITGDGAASLFDVDSGTERESSGELSDRRCRRYPSGARLGRITLSVPVSAGCVVAAPEGEVSKLAGVVPGTKKTEVWPILVVGTAEGQVHRFSLVAPPQTARRRGLMEIAKGLMGQDAVAAMRQGGAGRPKDMCLSNVHGIAAAVGPELVWTWLQVLDQQPFELVRFSLLCAVDESAALSRQLLKRLNGSEHGGEGLEPAALGSSERSSTGLPFDARQVIARSLRGALAEHAQRIELLATQAQRRRPRDRGPIKILWDRASRLGNEIAAIVVLERDPEVRRELLAGYFDLNRKLEVLANQWTGGDTHVEASALMHSFQCLFDWPDALILAGAPEWAMGDSSGQTEDAVQAARVRSQLLRRLVQERIFHAHPLVVTEALRVINLATVRALDFVYRSCERNGPLSTLIDARMPDTGWFELLAKVVGLGDRRRDLLRPGSAFAFEVAQFLALTLLLFPDSSLITGRFLSEWRLFRPTERDQVAGEYKAGWTDAPIDFDLATEVANLARELKARIEQELPPGKSKLRSAEGIARLSGFQSRQQRGIKMFRAYLKGEIGKTLEEPPSERPPDDCKYTNASLLWERRRVQNVVDALQDPLGSTDLLRAATESLKNMVQPIHYRESRQMLLDVLTVKHGEIQLAMQGMQSLREDEFFPPIFAEIGGPDLVSPQREEYRKIVEGWQRKWREASQNATGLIKTLDRYMRHVHQGTGQTLLGTVQDVVSRLYPFLPKSEDVSVRTALLEHVEDKPLLKRLVQETYDVNDRAFLQSAVLRAAQASRASSERSETRGLEGTTDASAIVSILRQACFHHGVEPSPSLSQQSRSNPSYRFPAPEYVWQAVFFELAANVAKYSDRPAEDGWSQERVLSVTEYYYCDNRWLVLRGGATVHAPPTRKSEHGRDMIVELCRFAQLEPREFVTPDEADVGTWCLLEHWQKHQGDEPWMIGNGPGRLTLALLLSRLPQSR